MALSLERVEALAPDQASLAAARKLLKPASWPTLAEAEGLVWGECQGSGSTPYRVVVSEQDGGYKCTCPSRKFPCKHSLALMWMRAEAKVAFAPAAVPEWVKDWLGRRRGPGVAAEKTEADDSPRPSIHALEPEAEAKADPKAEARGAAARERNRVEREAAILAGLDDLDVWLMDQVERGMATFVGLATKECRQIAQRLVDAKAPGLAGRLDALPAKLFTMAEAARPLAAVRELGQVHLIAEAYRRQGGLPAELAPDIRQAVGLPVTREALLADGDALRVAAAWRVVAVRTEVQADRLRRVETWLWREGGDETAPRFALLLDFIPVGTGAASGGYVVGDRVSAELVFYPSAMPQRAQIARIVGETRVPADRLDVPLPSLSQGFAGYQESLAQIPWLGAWPIPFAGARVRRKEDSLFLASDDDGLVLPLAAAQEDVARPLTTVDTVDGVGLWDGYAMTLCWAETNLGRWVNA